MVTSVSSPTTAPSNTGLKSQMGVGDPTTPKTNGSDRPDGASPQNENPGSDKQRQEFEAAFQQELGVINEHLQYTSVNAEAARHGAFATRRDALYPAFQSALAKIDPKDESKAQGDIDRVLGEVRTLSGEVASFRQETEQAKNDWDARQGEYDGAVRQVEELETWEDAQAGSLRGQADAIRTQTNERRWREGCAGLDSLKPTLQPIYEEYLRQREAKPQYEQMWAESGAKFEALKGAERPSQPMTAKAGEAEAAIDQARAKADAKDYVGGLEQMQTVGPAVDELDRMANDPERARFLAEIGTVDQIAQQPAGTPFKSQEADWSTITQLKDQITPAGDAGDYAAANTNLTDLKARVEAFKTQHGELEQQKTSYDTALTQLQPRLQEVTVSEPQYAKLAPMQQELAGAQAQMEASAEAEDFGQALTQAQDLSGKVDAIEQAKAEIDAKKQEYEAAQAALQPRIDAVSVSDPIYAKLEPMLAEITAARPAMDAAAQAGDYDQALTLAQDLTAKVDAYETAKAEIDTNKQAYEAALAALQPKLPTTCPTNAKLSALDGEITTLKGQMEAAATGHDYEKALELAEQVTAKADEFQKALAEYEKAKQDYEAALTALQPKLPTTCPVNPSLAERHSQIMALKGQMEAAANSQDYAKALELAKQLITKLDAYQKAVKETPPSPEKVKEVQDLITSGKKEEALQKAMEVYGVDKSQAKKIVYDASVSGEAETSEDGTITVGDKSFSSPGWLASSAAHEAEVHVNKQGKAGKWYTGTMGTAIQEVQAYDHEIANGHKYNLTEAEIKELKKRRQEHYDQLNGDYKKRADENNYDMKSGEEGL